MDGSWSAAEVSFDEGVAWLAVVAKLLSSVHISAVFKEGTLQEGYADSSSCGRGGSPSSQCYAELALGNQPWGTAHSVDGTS